VSVDVFGWEATASSTPSLFVSTNCTAMSWALTVKLWVPGVEVSTAPPEGTGPSQAG